jgi:hypothetical protein
MAGAEGALGVVWVKSVAFAGKSGGHIVVGPPGGRMRTNPYEAEDALPRGAPV